MHVHPDDPMWGDALVATSRPRLQDCMREVAGGLGVEVKVLGTVWVGLEDQDHLGGYSLTCRSLGHSAGSAPARSRSFTSHAPMGPRSIG